MSDVEPLVLREQPPVADPVDRPARFSQTFLQHADRCLRSAYLYLRHKGGPASHELARGTAFHIFMERITWLMVENGEERVPGEVAKDEMLNVLMEHPELQIPQDEQDYLRMMAWHVSEGLWLRPEQTIAVERKFVLEVGPWLVSGKADYAWLDGARAGIWDWKTSMNVPDQATFEAGIQLPLYACGLAFGKLVREEPCPGVCGGTGLVTRLTDGGAGNTGPEPCSECNGRGKVEHLEPWPILENAQEFELAEIYPAHLWERGLAQRVKTITRAELLDWHLALGATLNRVEHAFETGRWDAIPGKPQCDYCPASYACPLPARVRNHAGAINGMEEAIEAAVWWEFNRNTPTAVKKELKAFAGRPGGGPIRYGANLVLEFSTGRKREVDTDGLIEAANRRAEFGEPFDPDDFIKVTHPTNFGRRVLTKAELEAENGDGPVLPDVPTTKEEADERWGDGAPF
jgi:hypothetical protein